MSEWINIKNELPKETDKVLAYDGQYIRTGERMYFLDNEIYWMDGSVIYSGVTHWMPLPQPPEDDE